MEVIWDKELNDKQKRLLEEQINRFNQIKNSNIKNTDFKKDEKGKIVLQEGTLLHGTSFDIEKLKDIKENGILACEFLGKLEEDETFYCADFYRVPKTMKMQEYFDWCHESEQKGIIRMSKMECSRMPIRNQAGLVFIVNQNQNLKDLLSLDVYRDNEFTEEMKEVVNFEGIDNDRLYGSKERLSAILYGVPANMISGIWIGDYVRENEEYIEKLKQIFPESYIVDKEGSIIYEPVLDKDKKSWELTEEEKSKIGDIIPTQIKKGGEDRTR